MVAYFVTGTDTGVGKTAISAALLAAARRRGLRTAALKPAETGCPTGATGALEPADARFLHAAAGHDGDPRATCVHALAMPAAPAVAARAESRSISIPAITRAVHDRLTANPDLLLVEGAGGILVPFTDTHTAADLAADLDMPLIVVARPDLGTINHTALTIEAANRRGLTVSAVLFCATRAAGTDPTVVSNASEVERLTGVRVCGALPELPSLDLDVLADAADRHIDLDALLPRAPMARAP